MTNIFRPIQTKLDLGSDYLTPYLAYFLGGLCVGDIIKVNNEIYWISLDRHNPTITPEQLESHFNRVQSLARHIDKQDSIFMHDYFSGLKSYNTNKTIFSAGKKGFFTVFKELDNYSPELFVNDIQDALINSSDIVLKSFLIGVFDNKGSYDKKTKIAADVINGPFSDLIISALNALNMEYNYNRPKGDDRPGTPRSGQIRVNYKEYMSNLGYLSQQRLDLIVSHLDKSNIHYAIRLNNMIPFEGLNIITFE